MRRRKRNNMDHNTKIMLEGKIYDPFTEELRKGRERAHNLCLEFNSLKENDPRKQEILKELFPDAVDLYIQGPMQVDYGTYIKFGKGCYANFNFTVLDTCSVTIGDYVFIGPNVSIYTPLHPFLEDERRPYYMKDKGYVSDDEYGKPVTIGSNCWIGGSVTILPGVTIGEGCVIGAGSVVTRDIPPHSLAVGNPCRVIRKITKEDSIKLKKELW